MSSPADAIPAPATPRRAGFFWPALLLVGLTLLAYLPVSKAGYIWDDDAYLTANVYLNDLAGLREIWFTWGATPDYYPLTFTTFWLEKRVWGDSPTGYHMVNVVLHAVGAILLWRVLLRLRFSEGVALVCAAIFAVHPVHVESVAWICERKNVLSGALYFLAMLAFFRFYRYEDDEPIAAHRWPWLAMTIALYLLSELAKTVTVTLPVILLVIVWWKRARLTRRDIAIALGMLVLGLPLCYPAMWTQRHVVVAYGPEFDQTLLQRVLIAGRVIWFYAGKIVLPTNLTFIYPKWDINPAVWWQWLFPITAAATPFALWRLRDRIGRGPLAAVLCFGITLAPASGFFRIYWHRYSYVADHVQHLASTAIVVLLVCAAASLLQRFVRARATPMLVAAVVIGVLGVQAFVQCFAYRDAMTLWQDTIAKDPTSWMAISNRGVQYELLGDEARARADYERAIEINPKHYESLGNLATILTREKNYARAESLARRANEANPRYSPAYHALAKLALETGRPGEAVAVYRQAIDSRPRDSEMRYNLAVALARIGEIAESYTRFAEALKRNEDDAMTLRAMGRFLELQSRRGDAIAFYRKALAKDSSDIESMQRLAWLLATVSDDALRDGAEAVRLGERGVELTRGQAPEMLDALAAAYAEAGRFDEAATLASRVAATAEAMARSLPPPASDRARQLAQTAAQHAAAYAQKRPWREPAR